MKLPRGAGSPRLLIALAVLLVCAGGIAAAVMAGSDGGGGGERPAAHGHDDPRSAHPTAGGFKPDDRGLEDCKRDDRACYEQAFGNLAYRRGPKVALRIFDQKIASDRAIEANCHRIVHYIGSASLARFRGNVARAFAEGSASCWSGYYHGILERAFYGKPDDRLGEVARTLCDDAGIRRTTYVLYQCVHGLGHGLMIQSGYNLPKALGVCDQLETEWDKTSCDGGVFMENIATSSSSPVSTVGKSKWLKDDDLVYPCNSKVVGRRQKLYCYLMVTSRILQANGYDFRDAARHCRGVERAWVGTCFQSFGRDASGHTRQNPPEIARLCRLAGAHQADCVWGAARDMTSNYANGKRASQLCGLVPSRLEGHCFRAIGTILGTLGATSQQRVASCRGITKRHLRACVEGAGERLA